MIVENDSGVHIRGKMHLARPRKLKVLHVIGGMGIGGAEKVVLDLVRFADRERFSLSVCSVMQDQAQLENALRELGVSTYCAGRQRKSVGLLSLKRILKIIRAQEIDIVHTHLIGGDIYGRIAGAIARTPIIISTKHNADNGKRYYTLMNRVLCRLATDKVVAVSRDVATFCIKVDRVPTEKLLVIRNGINAGDFGCPRSVGTGFTFGVVASLTKQKGHTVFLKAAAAVSMKYPAVRYVLVGDGPLKRELEALAYELGLESKVVFMGNRNDVPVQLAAMDVFVLPSLWEGLSIALLEASAAGLPIIATAVSGSSEVVVDGKTGLLIPPGDTNALYSSMVWMIENPDRARSMAALGKARVTEQFNIREVVRDYESLYESVYSAKRRGRLK